ncbi:integrase catalytic domain-containing protein [Trichonephila clavipes]|nr:integrase catalytic domain-containing protein [Trichonephila clavipes]
MLTGKRRMLKSGLVAVETHLGWTLMGKVPEEETPKESSVLAMTVTSMFVNELAVVFLRIEKEDRIEVFFLTSKARVSSLRGASIPRVELLAAVIGTRLTNSVIKALKWKNIKRYYWSDSTTALAWIQRDDNWSVFVRNRVNKIRKLSDPTSWRHVPSEKNPADLPSRVANALRPLDWKQVERRGAVNAIEWKFNPPTAAWWGGWWEHLIRILKNLLGRASLSYEEMLTVLVDCESVINARPFTCVTESEAIKPISPSMFLQDIQEYKLQDIDALDSKSLTKRIKNRQNLIKDLRERA